MIAIREGQIWLVDVLDLHPNRLFVGCHVKEQVWRTWYGMDRNRIPFEDWTMRRIYESNGFWRIDQAHRLITLLWDPP
jgi:hypothetical protein